jgi:hypothetical protein
MIHTFSKNGRFRDDQVFRACPSCIAFAPLQHAFGRAFISNPLPTQVSACGLSTLIPHAEAMKIEITVNNGALIGC